MPNKSPLWAHCRAPGDSVKRASWLPNPEARGPGLTHPDLPGIGAGLPAEAVDFLVFQDCHLGSQEHASRQKNAVSGSWKPIRRRPRGGVRTRRRGAFLARGASPRRAARGARFHPTAAAFSPARAWEEAKAAFSGSNGTEPPCD